jgi:ABC-type transport system involved in cytochrome c biogenesis permease subunit
MYKAAIVVFHLSIAFYLAGLYYFLMYVFRKRSRLAMWGFRAMLCGLAIHGLSIGLIAAGQRVFPWANTLQNISFWSWVVVAISVALSHRPGLKVLGLFVLPLVVVLLLMAMTGQKSSSGYGEMVGRAFLGAVHVGLVFVAYASFAFAAVTGFMYILQNHFLKKKETGELYSNLPALDLLDKLSYRALGAGLAFLTVGLVLGFYWLAALPQKPEGFDPKVIGSLVIWAAYSVLLLMRATSFIRGRKMAWLSILGLVIIVLSFLFIPHSIPEKLQARRQASVGEDGVARIEAPGANGES